MQSYGIHIGQDIIGLLIAAFYMSVSWPFLRTAGRWAMAAALAGLSAIGSAPVLAQAVSRGDITVATYHLVWTIVGVAAIAKAYAVVRHTTPATATAETGAATAYYTNGHISS